MKKFMEGGKDVKIPNVVGKKVEDAKSKLEGLGLKVLEVTEESDQEMREMINSEIKDLTERKKELEDEIQILLLPKDPNDDKNVFVEIRGGAGGDEAALFAANLFRILQLLQ